MDRSAVRTAPPHDRVAIVTGSVLGAAALVAAACGEPPVTPGTGVTVEEGADGTRLVTTSLAALESLPEWTISLDPLVRIGAHEGAPGHDLFAVRSAFVLGDGRLVIANSGSAELRFYATDGAYLTSAGGEGEGPGEFVGLQRADPLPGDSILVYDSRTRRLSLFGPDGAFVSDNLLPAGETRAFTISSGTLGDGRLVTLSVDFPTAFEAGVRRDTSTTMLHERTGTVIDTLARQPGSEMVEVVGAGLAVAVLRAFGRQELAAAGGERIAVATNDELSFDMYDAAGTRTATVQVEARGCPTTDAEFEEWLAAEFDSEAPGLGAAARDVPRHETHPAFQSLDVDRLGNAWVGRRRCNSETTEYRIFSPEGLPVGRAALPDGARLLDIGSDYLVTRMRDELDREIVELHSLDRNDP